MWRSRRRSQCRATRQAPGCVLIGWATERCLCAGVGATVWTVTNRNLAARFPLRNLTKSHVLVEGRTAPARNGLVVEAVNPVP